jgi:hypothetical protein
MGTLAVVLQLKLQSKSYSMFLLVHGELLLLDGLQLVAEVELGRLLLQLRELVLVLGNLLKSWFDAETLVNEIFMV